MASAFAPSASPQQRPSVPAGIDFMRIAVISDSDEYCMPCGSAVPERVFRDMEFLCQKGHLYVCYSMKDLLPHAFSSEIPY